MSRRWIVLLLLLPLTAIGQVRVEAVRAAETTEGTRLVFDLSGPVEHSVFKLDNPARVVIDVSNASAGNLPAVGGAHGVVRGLRSGKRNARDLRLVIDLSTSVQPRTFVLRPDGDLGHRLVVDLPHAAGAAQAAPAPRPVAALRELVIAIDAGHGGRDPGAVGPSGVHEKDIVFAIAQRLAQLLVREYGMKPFMVRSGDYYVSHRERYERARRAGADLFISVHADAFHDRSAHGTSVYILSERGATSEAARLLAERENAADLVGGVKLDDKDDMLASVLLDLSQTGVIGASRNVGNHVLGELGRLGRSRQREVQGANFLVLKAPDVPSILVETGFISNPAEEARLRDAGHQLAVAQGMLNGIRAYFADHSPPNTLVAVNGIGGGAAADRQHVIARGETLSGIARRYNVSIQQIRSSNNLATDRIRVGQTILIPHG